jgi:hypothetical protein
MSHFHFCKAPLPTRSGKFCPSPDRAKVISPNSHIKSSIISPESRFETGFYNRRFGPHKSARFPDSKNVIQADYKGLKEKIAQNGSV